MATIHSVADFKREVRRWADAIGVRPARVDVRPMKRKWASCSPASGRLTFSPDLIAAPPRVRKSVIVHELLHLRVPNHGKLFRRLVAAHLKSGLK